MAATQDLLEDVAGIQASQAGVGGFGPGGGGPGTNAADGSCGPEPSDDALPDPGLLSLLPGNNQNQDTTSGGQSFTGDTKILLPNGKTAPISSLKPGDKIEAYDTKSGKDQAETVTAVQLHHDTNLYNLTIRSGGRTEVIHTTSSHLFWDPSLNKWIGVQWLDCDRGGRHRPEAARRLDVGPHRPRQQRPRLLRPRCAVR